MQNLFPWFGYGGGRGDTRHEEPIPGGGGYTRHEEPLPLIQLAPLKHYVGLYVVNLNKIYVAYCYVMFWTGEDEQSLAICTGPLSSMKILFRLGYACVGVVINDIFLTV